MIILIKVILLTVYRYIFNPPIASWQRFFAFVRNNKYPQVPGYTYSNLLSHTIALLKVMKKLGTELRIANFFLNGRLLTPAPGVGFDCVATKARARFCLIASLASCSSDRAQR